MKIEKFDISNMFGVRSIQCEPVKPITLFCGNNAAGKSSIQNAIRLAITGKPSRVALKKQYKEMITEGRKKGSVSVFFDTGEMCGIDLPNGSTAHMLDNDVLPVLLEPYAFKEMSNSDRRSFLFKLTGLSAGLDEIKRRLEDRGCNTVLAQSVYVMLKSGFPAAHDECKEKAKASKTLWKAVTGETYGAKKAETWEPEYPEDIDDAVNNESLIAELEAESSAIQQEMGEIVATRRNYAQYEKTVEKLKLESSDFKRKESRFNAATEMVENAKKEIEELESQVTEATKAYKCPCCENHLVMVDGRLEEYTHKPQDPAIANQLQRQREGLKSFENQLADARKHYNEANRAVIALENINVVMPADEERANLITEDYKSLVDKINSLRREATEQNQIKERIVTLKENKKLADSYHKNITDWLEIADAFAPDGIPGELLGEAIEPINERLKSSANITGWKQARITPDMEITADERPFYLLSDSEQWRCMAMIAETIGFVSGEKILFLDRFDVLEIKSRGALIRWLKTLASQDEINNAFVFGTLKSQPSSDDLMDSYWIEGGKL